MINLNTLKYFFAAFLITAVSLTGFAQAQKAEAELQDIMKQYDAVGLTVVVVKNSKIIYSKSFGLKNVAQNTPLAVNDMFRIASISKSFSATSIMQLIEAKKLSLDDDVSKLVGFKVRNPKFPETVITLRMIMSHTSSVNDSQGYFTLDAINPDKNKDWAKCYNDYAPGAGYQYCNLNYNMVGTIIERTSGERFDQYVKHHVLDPLGLYGGYCVDSLDKSRFVTLYEYHADTKTYTPAESAYAPHSEEIKNYVRGYSTPIFSPTGGMKISAIDLAKYMTMHMNLGKYKGGRIMSKKSAEIMQTPVALKQHYGLAIHTNTNIIPGKLMTGHTGSAYGLYSAMFFQRDEKFGFVVITNGCNMDEVDGMNPLSKASINCLYDNFIK